jgi:hypothetical protein
MVNAKRYPAMTPPQKLPKDQHLHGIGWGKDARLGNIAVCCGKMKVVQIWRLRIWVGYRVFVYPCPAQHRVRLIALINNKRKEKNMKKSLMILSVLVLVMSTPALSATCANGAGTQVIGVDGEIYCRSNRDMNWWSAHAWCDAAKMTLVSLDRCNGKNGDITGDTACPNFKGTGSGNCWTSSVPSSSYAFYVELSYGTVVPTPRHEGRNALCE